MLPSLGMFEMLIIGLIAIIVVGPKDLPAMMRKIGQYTRKIRELGNEFKSAFDDIGRETELGELRKEISDLRSLGKIGELSDRAFESEMRALDADIRDGTSLNHPRTSSAEPVTDAAQAEQIAQKAVPEAMHAPDTVNPKTTPKAKAKPKANSPSKPKPKAADKPKAQTTAKPKTKAKPKTAPKKPKSEIS